MSDEILRFNDGSVIYKVSACRNVEKKKKNPGSRHVIHLSSDVDIVKVAEEYKKFPLSSFRSTVTKPTTCVQYVCFTKQGHFYSRYIIASMHSEVK